MTVPPDEPPYPALTYRVSLSSQVTWYVCPGCGIVNAWSKEFGADETGAEVVTSYLCLACSSRRISASEVVFEEYATPGGITETMETWGRLLYDAAQSLFEDAARHGDPKTAAEIRAWMEKS